MKRWLALLLALLTGLCPLSAAATKPSDSPVPEIGMEETPLPDGRHFDSCIVDTHIHIDGTVSRTIFFSNSADREMAMRALYGADLEDQLRHRVAPLGGRFECTSAVLYGSGGFSNTSYTFHIENVSPEQILAFTNAVLQTEKNQFARNLTPYPQRIGCVTLTVNECFELANCLDEDALITSNMYVDVVQWIPNSEDTSSGSVRINENSLHSEEATVTAVTFIAPFERVTATVGAQSPEMGEVSLAFTPLSYADPIFRETALAGLRQAADGRTEIREEADGITLTFSGTPEEISRDLSGFVNAYVPEQGIAPGLRCYYPHLLSTGGGMLDGASASNSSWLIMSEQPYYLSSSLLIPSASKLAYPVADLEVKEAAFTLSPLETADRFRTGLLGSLTLDLRPVTGQTALILRGGEGTELIPEEAVQFDSGLYSDTRLELRFIHTQKVLAPLPFIIIGSLLLLAGLALLIWRFRDIRRLFSRLVPAAPAAPAAQPEEPETEEEEPITFEIPEIIIAEEDENPAPKIAIDGGEEKP